jgi:hypothetical protein
MADDTPTVEHAKHDLIAVVNPAHGVTAERVLLNIDALIAAVRAEARQDADDRWRHQLARHTLTDTDVDTFLAACENQQPDPERVERIRQLFQQKLTRWQDRP